MLCDLMYFGRFSKIFLRITREKDPPTPSPPELLSAGSDWLGVDLEVRSLCCCPHLRQEKRRIFLISADNTQKVKLRAQISS